MTKICSHDWKETYSNLKETKYQCSECGATQIVSRWLEKHTHEPIQDDE
ncbi:hypothetical protein KAI60_03990 [Candidatus Bathyarchaeota archaeon]|nr:hypothetical protein [Candidatus Bathyarchaeota archaeon]